MTGEIHLNRVRQELLVFSAARDLAEQVDQSKRCPQREVFAELQSAFVPSKWKSVWGATRVWMLLVQRANGPNDVFW